MCKTGDSNPERVGGLPIPAELRELIASGWWPRTIEEAAPQHSRPLVPMERVREVFPGQPGLWLRNPPFITVREDDVPHFIHRLWRRPDSVKASSWILKRRLFWWDVYCESYWRNEASAPEEINFDLAIEIGDFGWGSDAPIILDYQRNREQPSVRYLKWSFTQPGGKPDNHWVEAAPTFADLMRRLGVIK